MAYNNKFFTRKNDGSSIKFFIACHKFDFPRCWKNQIGYYLKDEAAIWWKSLDSEILKLCRADEIEELFLDKWFHTRKEELNNLANILLVHERRKPRNLKGYFLLVSPYCRFMD